MNIISEIVAQQAALEEQARQERRQAVDELASIARANLIGMLEQVPGLYEELKPYIREDAEYSGRTNDDLEVDVEWEIKSDELQLMPIVFKATVGKRGRNKVAIKTHGMNMQPDQIRQAINLARDGYQDWKKEADEKFIRSLKSYFWYSNNRDEAIMQEAYVSLMHRFPERADEWNDLAESWRGEQNRVQRERKEEEEYRTKREAEKASLLERMTEHYRACKEIRSRNQAKVADLQNRLDQPAQYFQLEYAYAGGDDETGTIVETNTVWVSNPQVDQDGMWTLVDGTKRKFYHVVSLTPRVAKPTDCIRHLYKMREWREFGIGLRFAIDQADEVDALVAFANFELLPRAPEMNELLSYDDIEVICSEAMRAAEYSEWDD